MVCSGAFNLPGYVLLCMVGTLVCVGYKGEYSVQ